MTEFLIGLFGLKLFLGVALGVMVTLSLMVFSLAAPHNRMDTFKRGEE